MKFCDFLVAIIWSLTFLRVMHISIYDHPSLLVVGYPCQSTHGHHRLNIYTKSLQLKAIITSYLFHTLHVSKTCFDGR